MKRTGAASVAVLVGQAAVKAQGSVPLPDSSSSGHDLIWAIWTCKLTQTFSTDWYATQDEARDAVAELDFQLPVGPGDQPYNLLFPDPEPGPESLWIRETLSVGDTTGMTATFKISELLEGPRGGNLWLSVLIEFDMFPNLDTGFAEFRARVKFNSGKKYRFIYWE